MCPIFRQSHHSYRIIASYKRHSGTTPGVVLTRIQYFHRVPSAGDGGGESSDGSEGGEAEEGRWLAWADERGMLSIAHLPPPALVGRSGNLQPLHSMRLLPGETIAQVHTTKLDASCQILMYNTFQF